MEQELIKKGRLLALRIFAESYLISQGKENTDELFADREITEKTAISGEECQVLHHYLIDDYKGMGLNLEKIIEASGQATDGKRLSNYEINELVRRADMLLIQISVIKKYVDNK